MEFLRFGSRISGGYWGCCAIDIIQDFSQDPDDKTSIQVTSGDTGTALGDKYLGPTQKDVFLNRLRIGTFGHRDMPNHVFLAAMTSTQLQNTVGKKWLVILREAGFEFIRATDNSVSTGSDIDKSRGFGHKVYVFGLFRNIGGAALDDPFEPPKEWTDLPEQTKTQEEIWREGETTILTAQQIIDAGAPLIKAGTMGKPPEDITDANKQKIAAKAEGKAEEVSLNPFLTLETFEVIKS